MRLSKTTKNALLIGAGVLAIVILVGLLGFASGGFTETNPQNWELYSINKNNYFKLDDYTVKTSNSGNGYSISVDDYGQIKVSGKNETTAAVEIAVQEITLPAGTYTFTSGASGTSNNGYNMSLKNTTQTIHADYGDNTFTLEAETTFTAYINIGAEKSCNITFSPVIVEGEEAGNFFNVGSGK